MRFVPNTLTCLRLLLGLGFPFLHPKLWFPVLLLALVTEYLDGFLARSCRRVSVLGQMLDPIADKIFVLSVAATFLFFGYLTPLDLVLLALRDIVVTVGVFAVLVTRQRHLLREMRPGYAGKLATTLQFAVLGGVALFQRLEPMLFYIAATVSAIAAADYIRRFWKEVVVKGKLKERPHG